MRTYENAKCKETGMCPEYRIERKRKRIREEEFRLIVSQNKGKDRYVLGIRERQKERQNVTQNERKKRKKERERERDHHFQLLCRLDFAPFLHCGVKVRRLSSL